MYKFQIESPLEIAVELEKLQSKWGDTVLILVVHEWQLSGRQYQ